MAAGKKKTSAPGTGTGAGRALFTMPADRELTVIPGVRMLNTWPAFNLNVLEKSDVTVPWSPNGLLSLRAVTLIAIVKPIEAPRGTEKKPVESGVLMSIC